MKEIKIIFSLAFSLAMLITIIPFEICSLKYASIYAQTNDQCSPQLINAEEEYRLGNWNESIEIINKCLSKPNLSVIEKGKAYRILSLVYIARRSEVEASNAVKNLLTMIPNYKLQQGRDLPLLHKFIYDISPTLVPEINYIFPSSRVQNDDGFTMSVTGSNFVYGSKVMMNGNGKETTFISDSVLLAKIPASNMLFDDEYKITVYNPILNGRTSNTEKFVVKSSSLSFWEWFGLGSVATVLVVTAIHLLKPYPDPLPIAEPPGRP